MFIRTCSTMCKTMAVVCCPTCGGDRGTLKNYCVDRTTKNTYEREVCITYHYCNNNKRVICLYFKYFRGTTIVA